MTSGKWVGYYCMANSAYSQALLDWLEAFLYTLQGLHSRAIYCKMDKEILVETRVYCSSLNCRFVLHDLIIMVKQNIIPGACLPFPQVQEALDQEDGTIKPGVVVACFLVQEGADIHLTNKNGLTPLQMCSKSSEIVAKVLEFAEKHAGLATWCM